MKIELKVHQLLNSTLHEMKNNRSRWVNHWKDLARMYLARRYSWLLTAKETNGLERNSLILDGTGTYAAQSLASGMMDGITSPARPWLVLGARGVDLKTNLNLARWLQAAEQVLFSIFSESNFYNAMSVLYFDLVIFGTSAMLVYEDDETIIRCYNSAVGEFFLNQSQKLKIDTFAREFNYSVRQTVDRWGIESVSENVRTMYKQGGGSALKQVEIKHIIRPYDPKENLIAKSFKYIEFYWEKGTSDGLILGIKGYNELPGVFPRWETIGNENYGSSPGMDNYPDVVQLQHETKMKAQGIDKMIRPPMVADVQLQHKPKALVPNGITFVSGVNSVGMKPIHDLRLPLAEMSADIQVIQQRIKRGFHNDIFQLISNLETVRSATEIDGLREEKLVRLGPVLERFKNEVLDPVVLRTFKIAQRRGLIPPLPEEFKSDDIEIRYNSILSVAQKAFNTIPTERWLQLIGNASALYPTAPNVANIDELLRNYAIAIGVPASEINSIDEVEEKNREQQELQDLRETAATGGALVDSAKQLSETAVGGGTSALEQLLG